MQNLVGKTILIGREPETNHLLLSVEVNGQMRNKSFDMHVPNTVSRCVPNTKSGHCQIEVKNPDMILIHNKKENNCTYVNSQEVLQKRINRNSKVELGPDHFGLDIDKILTSAIQLANPMIPYTPEEPKCVDPAPFKPQPIVQQPQKPGTKDPGTYSLAHLKPIWADYEKENAAINKQHEKIVRIRQTIQRCIMIGGPLIAGSIQLVDDNSVVSKIVITLIVVAISMGLGFVLPNLIKDGSEERRKLLEADFKRRYVCPNPSCNIHFGKLSYDMLEPRMRCGNCGCKYINNLKIEEA